MDINGASSDTTGYHTMGPAAAFELPTRVVAVVLPVEGDRVGAPHFHELNFPTFDGKEDPLPWNLD